MAEGELLRPARLPLRARVLGGIAVVIWIASGTALVLDLIAGRAPWAAGGFFSTLSVSLAWVLADSPTGYRFGGGVLEVRTRLRVIHRPCISVGHVGTVGKDRFAINGGFGWFGWFSLEGKIVRAWVTDPARAVRVETGGRAVLISPAPP
ncbi:hypothetical protein LBMAG42_40270 [Deltaproteobacteria bacterium]|nr:hypothetical protein LBMAG42_40270 [Deltaproteobacteria bacterium]